MKIPVKAEKNGYISRFDTRDIGLAVVALGGGRLRSDQVIDPAVGLTDIVELGQEVVQGEDLMMIHAQSEKDAEIALKMIQKACYIHDEKPRALPLIPKRISVQDL